MRRLRTMGLAAAVAVLGGSVAAAVAAGPIQAQYDGPMMGGPDDGMPGSGPGMGPGGRGPYGGGFGMGPRRESRGPVGPFQSYHGFRVDIGEAQGAIDVPSAMGEVEHQIDIVDRAGVSAAMLAKFRAVPIRISATFAGGGSHYRGGSEVTLGSLQPGDDRPVLLHEYMHVLEYRTFPGGFRNPTVLRFYEEAQARGLYPAESYMMSNPAEFFAVTASCFLNGTVARDPYTRGAIRERQPDYFAYLSSVFGRRLDAAAAAAPATVAALR